MKELKVLYHNDKLKPLEFVENKSDWIDLRCSENIELKAGEYRILPLGISVQLPEGYEAHVALRSSSFKNWGILQTNAVGIVDESYCGNDDMWGIPIYATRDTQIHLNDRVCQFRIVKKMEKIVFKTVDTLTADSRGGFGSTGIK